MVTALKVKLGVHIFIERKKRNISQVIDVAVLPSIEKIISNRSVVKSTVDETHASNIRSRNPTLQVENVPKDLLFSSAPKPSQNDDQDGSTLIHFSLDVSSHFFEQASFSPHLAHARKGSAAQKLLFDCVAIDEQLQTKVSR